MSTVWARLHALYPEASRTTLKKWLERARVRLNGDVVRRGDIPAGPGDRVELGAPPPPSLASPLRLVHEDDDLLVVDKPPGLLTIATEGERTRTAYRLVFDYAHARGGRVFVVHRLDRETSGLLVFARSVDAKRRLQAQWEARTVERVYEAIVEGRMREGEGVLTARLREDRSRRVRPTRAAGLGKEAVTRYRVLARGRDTTRVELRLVTGRRGQIRVQLADLGHPIVGDVEYGSRLNPVRRLCLHATRLAFRHPRRGDRVAFESPAPPVFDRVR
ncbi:MAG TPA: RluA family pseudouridine synthase [Methylomirabilota bacterium]|jgi:23S rRNA pseudouridine1911/1915/1917 synthase